MKFCRSLLVASELVDLVLQLLVDGGELFVCRLKLLVHRHHFFVRAFQLFVRGLQFLDGGAQLGSRLVELVLELFDADFVGITVGFDIGIAFDVAAEGGYVLEYQQHVVFVERIGDEIHEVGVIVVAVDAKITLDRALLIAPRIVEHTADGRTKTSLSKLGHLGGRPAFGELEIFAGAVRGANDFVIVADHDMRRRIAFHHAPHDGIAALQDRGGPAFRTVRLERSMDQRLDE